MINQIGAFFSSFHIIDIVCALFILFMAIRGIFFGFIVSLFNNVALWGGLICALFFSAYLSPIVKNSGVKVGSYVVAFLIIFIAFYLAVKLIEHFILKVTQNDSINNLDKALGFFLGLFYGVAIIVLIYIVIQKTVCLYLNLDSFFSKSYFATTIDKFFGSLYGKASG